MSEDTKEDIIVAALNKYNSSLTGTYTQKIDSTSATPKYFTEHYVFFLELSSREFYYAQK